MTAILFDATTFRNASADFGLGVLPPAPAPLPRARRDRDQYGNLIPSGRNDADYAWYADQVQARMDCQADVAEMLEEGARLDAMEREWLANVEWRERSDMPAGYFS